MNITVSIEYTDHEEYILEAIDAAKLICDRVNRVDDDTNDGAKFYHWATMIGESPYNLAHKCIKAMLEGMYGSDADAIYDMMGDSDIPVRKAAEYVMLKNIDKGY